MPLWLLGTLITGGGVALSVFGLALVRRAVAPERLRAHHDVAGFLLAIVGVIYAVLLAFVVIVVWEEFEESKVFTEQEANALIDIYRMAPGFSPAAALELRRNVRAYAQSVVDEEWPAMSRGESDDRTARALDHLWMHFTRMQPHGARETSLYDQSLARLVEVSDNRRLRLLASHSGVPGPMWVVLIFGGVATILFTYFFGLESFRVQAGMTALLAATVGLVLFIISALNYPFSGDLRIPPEAMQSVLERFESIQAHEAPVPPVTNSH